MTSKNVLYTSVSTKAMGLAKESGRFVDHGSESLSTPSTRAPSQLVRS